MRRLPFHLAFQGVVAVLGCLSAAALFFGTSNRLAPPEPSCLVLATGCWSLSGYAYNDPGAGDPIISDKACLPSNLLNFVWCNEYDGMHYSTFSTFGGGGGLDGHLVSLYQAAAQPSVKTVLYINAPGGIHSFLFPETTLLASLVLDRIRRDYPQTADDVEIFSRYLHGSVGYQKALEEKGHDWQQRVDPVTLTFPPAGSAGAPYEDAVLPPDGVGDSFTPRSFTPRAVMVRLSKQCRGVRDSFTHRSFTFYDRSYDRLSHFALPWGPQPRLSPMCVKSNRIIELLDACASRYLHPGNEKYVRAMVKKEDYWATSGGDEVWRSWARIVAAICEARGIRFVYYIPPHIHLSPSEYRDVFKPAYVDRVRDTFCTYPHVVLIDHAMASGFNPADLIWFNHHHGMPIKAGYLFNVIGRLKFARQFISSLLDTDSLDPGRPRSQYLGSAWPGEAFLPPGPSTFSFVPEDKAHLVEELVLEPAYRVRSTQAPARHAQN